MRLGKRAQGDLDQDIRDHIEREIEDNIARGMSPEEARRQAMLTFGNVARVQENTRAVWTWHWLECVGHDARDAARTLRRHPGFAAAATLTLALGIGANVAVFSAARAVLIDKPPYPNAERLVRLRQPNPFIGDPFDAADIQTFGQVSSFSHVTGCDRLQPQLGDGPSILITATEVTPEFFRVFSTPPLAGRVLGVDDFAPSARHVVVSYLVWRAQLGGAADAVGQSIRLNQASWTVVGVMPPEFAPPCSEDARATRWVWIPRGPRQEAEAVGRRRTGGLDVFAMLAPGAGMSEAQSQVDVVTNRLAVERSDARYVGSYLEGLRESDAAALKPGLLLLQGVAGFLLLITCANLGNLFLAQASQRRREFALRAALGAGRGRLVAQVLTEGGVIATAGAGLAIILASWARGWLGWLAAPVLPKDVILHVDFQELAFGLGIGWLTVVIFGTVPALLASRVDVMESLRGVGQTTVSPFVRRFRNSLVTAQVLLAVVLLTGAGLLIRSFMNVAAVPLGFDTRGLLTTEMNLPPVSEASWVTQRQDTMHDLREALQPARGISSVAFCTTPVFNAGDATGSHFWTLRQPGLADVPLAVQLKKVSPNYLEVLGVPLTRGRLFRSEDFATHPAAVVSEAFVRRIGGTRDLIGSTIWFGDLSYTIVGVVGDVHSAWLTQPARPTFYVPIDGFGSSILLPLNTAVVPQHLSVIVRATNQNLATAALRDAIERVGHGGLVTAIEPIAITIWAGEQRRRFYSVLLSVFAVLSGVVAAVGIYGVVARVTELRRAELGIRLALGARPGALVRMVIRQGLRPVLVGVAGGLVGSWWTTGLLSTNESFRFFLFQVTTHDAWTFAAVAVGLLMVSLAACWIPARSVAQFNPTAVLREP